MKTMYDVVVIGAGPAGESAALNAAKHGLRAAIIENQPHVGGACTHKGTIPSKVLREMVAQLKHYNASFLFRSKEGPLNVDFEQFIHSADSIIQKQVELKTQYYAKNRIDVFHGSAQFLDDHTVQVTYPYHHHRKDSCDAADTLQAKHIVIATGSRPYHPPDVDFEHPCIYDSDTILKMKDIPNRLIIYGAGVIGCEYASIFSGLGISVDLINTQDRLLNFLDDEISDALTYHLRAYRVTVRHNEAYESVDTSLEHGVCLKLKSGKKIRADALLWCNGRTGNTDTLNLEAVNLKADHRGKIHVNKRYLTSVDNIYAVGDVIGWPSLASAAFDQGRSAAAGIRGKSKCRYVDDVPTGIYTIPEISSIGKTERELTQEKIPYEVGRALFKDIARAQIRGETVGMLKLLFHSETLEILGVHCFGSEATEIIHIGQSIMKQENGGNNVRYFVTTTFNYPTMAEAYRVAALNGINRLDPVMGMTRSRSLVSCSSEMEESPRSVSVSSGLNEMI
jgi:NAD(P) transhydrogenase